MSRLIVRSSAGSQSALMADWLARSTAPGIVWAQRFTSQADVEKYIVYGTGRTLADVVPAYKYCAAGEGMLGDGCLGMVSPTGDIGAGVGTWYKPFSPIAGVDVNNAGVATISNFTQIQDDGVWGNTNLGGYFTHSGTGTGVIGNEFWWTHLAKTSSNRFDSTQPRGKNLFLTVNNIGTPTQEIVCDYETGYGGKWLSHYTNPGGWNASIYDPQRSDSNAQNGDKIQNQAPYASTCIIGNFPGSSGNCWVVTPGEWYAIMFHVIVGSQATDRTNMGTAPISASNPKDQTLEIFVAKKGETSYTPIFSKTDLQFDFEASALALGYNIGGLLDYTGGNDEIPADTTFRHFYDQVTLTKGSTQPACPQAWPA